MRKWLEIASYGVTSVSLSILGSGVEAQPEQTPTPPHFERKAGDDDVAHGQRLATILFCKLCHGPDLAGSVVEKPGLYQVWSAN